MKPIIYEDENGAYDTDDIKSLINQVDQLQASNARLREGLDSVAELIDNSTGVSGLHMSGDIADWRDLLEGGSFEEWLIDFSKAIDETTAQSLSHIEARGVRKYKEHVRSSINMQLSCTKPTWYKSIKGVGDDEYIEITLAQVDKFAKELEDGKQ